MKKLLLILALLYFWPEISPFLLPCVRELSNVVRIAVRELTQPPVAAEQEPVAIHKPREKCA